MYKNASEKEEYMLEEAKELINDRSTITVDKEEYKQLLSDVSSLKQRTTNYDIIFNYDSTVANKCADKCGTFALELGEGKTSVNDYKYLIVIAQTTLFDTETTNIVYNFPDENITKKLYSDNTQYCNSAYYDTSYYYLIRYIFTDNEVIIGSIQKKGWSGAVIKKIIGVY